jgi:hypothetical protein
LNKLNDEAVSKQRNSLFFVDFIRNTLRERSQIRDYQRLKLHFHTDSFSCYFRLVFPETYTSL